MIAPKNVAQFAFHHGGPLWLARRQNRTKLRILMYHRFAPEYADRFRRQCEHIVRYYHPITLTAAGQGLKNGDPFPDNTIVITIDDGYRDFYANAFPALKEFGIPATLFLTTGVVDGFTWFWWDKLQFALDNTPKQSISLAGEQDVPLRNPKEREAALHRVADALTRIPNLERLHLIDDLPSCFEVEIPATPPEAFQTLRWSEVREMAKYGLEFGAHTVTHPILSRVETTEELRKEIETSRDRVTEELGVPTRHFCYPSGRAEDLDGRVKTLAEAAGFETAVTTESGLNTKDSDLLLLKRVGVDSKCDPYYFARQLSGFRLAK